MATKKQIETMLSTIESEPYDGVTGLALRSGSGLFTVEQTGGDEFTQRFTDGRDDKTYTRKEIVKRLSKYDDNALARFDTVYIGGTFDGMTIAEVEEKMRADVAVEEAIAGELAGKTDGFSDEQLAKFREELDREHAEEEEQRRERLGMPKKTASANAEKKHRGRSRTAKQEKEKIERIAVVSMRAIRKEKGISVKTVAEHLGKHTSTVSEYERDVHTPSVAVIAQIAEVLDCDPADLTKPVEVVQDDAAAATGVEANAEAVAADVDL